MSASHPTGPSPKGGAPRFLTDEHREFLSAAAITPDIAASAGVHSALEAADLPAELHAWRGELPGIVFPWWRAEADPDDGPVLWQFRPDTPIARKDGRGVMKYVFPKNARQGFNVHPVMASLVADVSVPLVLVEGTKQTLAAVSALTGEGTAVVGMAGCYGWSQDQNPIADIKAIPWRGRQVFLCFDADVATNRDVWEAAGKLRDWLSVQGARSVQLVKLPGSGTTGLDDVLAATVEPREAMAGLLAAAGAKTNKWPNRRPARSKASTYFDEDGGLLAEKAADVLLDEHPCALTAGDGNIAVYDSGRFVLRGKDPLMTYVTDMLGDRYRPVHLTTITHMVIGKLIGEGKRLPERPAERLLNVRNGMLNLDTLKLSPHSPDYLSAVQLPLEWDPDAVCPTYEHWLSTVVSPRQVDDLEEVSSTMLDPIASPRKSLFLIGPTRSGKSTFLRIMKAVMGDESTSSVTLHQLSENRFMCAALYGKKLNVASDLSSRHVEDLSIWKMLTGDDMINAELKNINTFQFTNQALFAFSANEPPSVSESSGAYFARIKPFSFPRSFAGAEDPSIENTIMRDELPGVLVRWIVALSRLTQRGTFAVTDPDAASEFETATDRVRLWVAEERATVALLPDGTAVAEGMTVGTATGTTKADLFEAYRSWAKDNGYGAIGKQKFLARLTSIDGIVEVRIRPSKTRGLNIIPAKDDLDFPSSTSPSLSPVAVVAVLKESSTKGLEVEESHSNGVAVKTSSRIGEVGVQTATATAPPKTERGVLDLEPEPAKPAEGTVEIEFTVWTRLVYDLIASDPDKITKKRIGDELDITTGDLTAELDHLERHGVLARRGGRRGFDLLAVPVESLGEYTPCADPVWVGEPNMEPLFEFEFACVRCGEPDDELSEYFPACASCRLIAGE